MIQGTPENWADYDANLGRVSALTRGGALMPSSRNYDPGYVYLAKCGPYYKIGKSTRPGRRIASIALQMPHPLQVVNVWETETMSCMERTMHLWWGHRRRNGEWFELSDFDVEVLRDQAATWVGPSGVDWEDQETA